MDTQNLLRWVAIIVSIGGMIIWMITYQLCTVYIRKNKEDIANILYKDKNYFNKKIDGYQIHSLIMTSSMVFSHYFIFYKKSKRFYLETVPWCPNLDDRQALRMYEKHKYLLLLSELAFLLIVIWFVFSGLFIWLATRIG